MDYERIEREKIKEELKSYRETPNKYEDDIYNYDEDNCTYESIMNDW